MGIFRSTDPTVWDDVDGIIINESAPAPNVQGVAANVGILVAACERGPSTMQEPGAIGDFHEMYGKSLTFGANLALKNKKFGRLKIIRVVASDSVTATKAFQSTATDRITFTAKQGPGAYGNNIQVKIESGTTTGKKYSIKDTSTYAVLPEEVYDNVAITDISTTLPFANSKLITAVVNSSAAEPTNTAYTALATGADGSIANSDYSTAIDKAAVEKAGNVIFLDSYNATRNGYLKAHVAATQDKMAILAGLESDSVSDAITDAASYRDTDGRLIYAYPWIQTNLDGVLTMTNPASWYAAIITQTAPNVDPAFAENTKFLSGVTGLKLAINRSNYVNLRAAGISAFEFDEDIGYKVKSGVVTQISNSSKLKISRRRMADYLTNSVGLYLKNYQNAVNSKENRTFVKGAIMAFIKMQEDAKLLPKDSEVKTGVAKLVDTESANTDNSVAAGFFRIIWKQRIYSSMDFIVLNAEIGESVVVTEQAS